MAESEKREISQLIGKGLIAAIPYVGGSITSLWSDVQAKRKEERLLDFVNSIESDVMLLKEKINQNYVSESDFLDLFEMTADRTAKERVAEKRQGYKNILVNSIVNQDVDFDRTETFIILLGNLNLNELVLLSAFDSPLTFNTGLGSPVTGPNDFTGSGYHSSQNYNMSVLEVLQQLLPKWTPDDIDEAMHGLFFYRLIKLQDPRSYRLTTNGHPILTLDNKLTSKGKQFVRFVRDA